MEISTTKLQGVLVISPKVFGDDRGFFMESYHAARYKNAGITSTFVQDNLSYSRRGILRGLHLQCPNAQAKLVTVLQGEVFDVAVDLRRNSPTFGQWEGIYLNAENKKQFFLPAGFAHGFCVTSETALFSYKCSKLYAPQNELTLLWNDPDLNIEWPIADPLLSEKDQKGIRLRDLPKERLQGV